MQNKALFILTIILIVFLASTLYSNTKIEQLFNKIVSVAIENNIDNIPIKYKIVDSKKLKITTQKHNQIEGYRILISSQFKKIANENEYGFAFILAHEFAHIELGHLENSANNQDEIVENANSRQQELNSDKRSMQLLLECGYSYKKILEGIKKLSISHNNYSLYESIGYQHPTWEERLASIDSLNSQIWNSMLAFKNGVLFLNTENYELAAQCFSDVINEFPKCYEAWTNKGYADLMQYCEKLTAEELIELKAGYFAGSTYFKHPNSLNKTLRGIDDELWLEAYSSLKASIDINKNQPFCLSYLALSYLLNPYKSQDLKNSIKYLDLSVKLVEKLNDRSLKNDIYNNAGVIYLAKGNLNEAKDYFAQTLNYQPEIFLFNQALIAYFSNEQNSQNIAIDKFERFLNLCEKNIIWNDIAYYYYSKLCSNTGIKPKDFSLFNNLANQTLLPVLQLPLQNDNIYLSENIENIEKIVKKIGKYRTSTLNISDNKINKHIFNQLGIEIIEDSKIIAIILNSNYKFEIPINQKGLQKSDIALKIGESYQNLPQALKNYFKKHSFTRSLDNNSYLFSAELGLGISLENNIVRRIIITRL